MSDWVLCGFCQRTCINWAERLPEDDGGCGRTPTELINWTRAGRWHLIYAKGRIDRKISPVSPTDVITTPGITAHKPKNTVHGILCFCWCAELILKGIWSVQFICMWYESDLEPASALLGVLFCPISSTNHRSIHIGAEDEGYQVFVLEGWRLKVFFMTKKQTGFNVRQRLSPAIYMCVRCILMSLFLFIINITCFSFFFLVLKAAEASTQPKPSP